MQRHLIQIPAELPKEYDDTLGQAGAVADAFAAQDQFQVYHQTLAANTQRRQRCELEAFVRYLAEVGVQRLASQLYADVTAWRGMTAGLLQGFVRWQVKCGVAIGTINLRLSTIKRYCALALAARMLSAEDYALIAQVKSYSHKAGRNLDRQREVSRIGHKKVEPTIISQAHARLLKQQPPDTPLGRRDGLLMCLLLDHGLRCGEVVALQVSQLNLAEATLAFYREKVDLRQTHDLTPDTLRAAQAYLPDVESEAWLFPGYPTTDGLLQSLGERAVHARVCLLGRRIGIEELGPHDCRHYWATQAMRSGTSIDRLQEAGGWKSPTMPLRYATRARRANEGVKLAHEGEIECRDPQP
jgi:integrase